MFVETIVFIILFIVAIIVIASASYSSDNAPETKGMKAFKSLDKFTLTSITPESQGNCYTFTIDQICANKSYIVSGEFERSCVSIYLDNERIHSRECNGNKSLVFSSNLNLTSQIFKLNKNKSELLPLQLGKSYKIVFNNVNELNVKEYKVNYSIDYKNIEYNYTLGVGVNEYDIYQQVKDNYTGLERYYLKNGNKENMWCMNEPGKYLVIIIDNLYNLDVSINNSSYNTRKVLSETPALNILTITDPNITVFNLDFITKIKDINQEYLDFITSPNYLMNKFIYGSKNKKADYISQVNNKFIIYKLA
jgi:hypothetical protein